RGGGVSGAGPPAPRPAREADAAAMARIARAAYAPYVTEIGFEPPPMVQDFPAAIAAGRSWVIGEPLLGFVVAYSIGADWHIENVAVDRHAQGRGIGRALIAAAEAEGRARGHARVVLYTNAAMRPNLTLYPRLGYARTARRVEHGLDRVYFEKRLEPEP
ncbi:MAG TPA: GNAT family N-acetyltransferase, partial [Thermohalobaculum sp.]|nr:GNAT family N-acetyltransferase [Thermohalobaculum sp.]